MNMHTVVDGGRKHVRTTEKRSHTHHGWIGGGGGVLSARMEN